MEKLFSYGTLQQDNVQLETFGRLLEGQAEVLIGYELSEVRITDPLVLQASGKEFHPILRQTKNPENKVNGTVFDVTANELTQADTYEVDDYVRVSADLESGHTAWVYVAAER